jgi:hypothetical protein
MQFGLRHLFEALTYVAIVAWGLQAYSTTYEVYGTNAGIVRVAVFFGVIASMPLLLFFRARTIVRFGVAAVLAFSISQATYTRRLAALRTEVASIIAYVDEYKLQHGLYPTDLSGYEFQRPELATFIEYRDAYPTTSYEIRWHPIQREDLGHWYGADYGHYYEDD